VIVPNAHKAVVPAEKIAAYLLNSQHPDGAGKARFFLAAGFRADEWPALANAFKQLLQRTSFVNEVESAHGRKYVVEGSIDTPSGKFVRVRTVWIVENDDAVPRLVTAFPLALGD
jgi:hypothetical protein